MSIIFVNPYSYDPDAEDYINRVIAADVAAGDTNGLEVGVQDAINTFFVGCKNDGIWDAIKASCILAGARTLNGALVPLAGDAPTNYNFVAGDYDRETGLLGDGSTKYLNSNRNNNADPQDNKHVSVYRSVSETRDATRAAIGNGTGVVGDTHLLTTTTARFYRINTNLGSSQSDNTATAGFWGASRSSASGTTGRYAGSSNFYSDTSATPRSELLNIFQRGGSFTNARIAFYSIGESLDLALLDARVTALMTDLAAAIP